MDPLQCLLIDLLIYMEELVSKWKTQLEKL